MSRRRRPTATLALALPCLGCSGGEAPPRSAAGPPAWFEEVARDRGLRFEHESGADGRYFMPEIMGGGAALFDADGDGDLDAYLVQSGAPLAARGEQPGNRLFLNLGGGRFSDATEGSGADDRGYGMGVACGDVEADGDVDLYVTNRGPNALLCNDGRGRFAATTADAGVGHAGWGTSAAFADLDRNGFLDLYVCNYLGWSAGAERECENRMGTRDYCEPKAYDSPSADTLYRNRGDGRFLDVSAASGVASERRMGLGVVCADFDRDGWTDVFVANDTMADLLWRNRGDGTFVDDAMRAGCAVDAHGYEKAGMGVAAADLDDDGRPDLLVGNLTQQTDSLFFGGDRGFSDRTEAAGLGVGQAFTRFGLGFADFDNDGRLDLYEANGRIARLVRRFGPDPYAEPNLLFRGTPGARFEEVLPRGGTAELLAATSRCAAFGDVDDDGGVDVLVVNRDGPAHLLRNRVPGRGSWIAFRVVDRGGGPALHAEVSVRVGKRLVRREVRAAYGYLGSSSPRVHLGLGSLDAVDEVKVRWADGAEDAFGSFPAGAVVDLIRPPPPAGG